MWVDNERKYRFFHLYLHRTPMFSVPQFAGRPVLHYTASNILPKTRFRPSDALPGAWYRRLRKKKKGEKAEERNNRWHATGTQIIDPNFWLLYSVVQ
jgi:hypothetical protein